jgi:hypothetical protein
MVELKTQKDIIFGWDNSDGINAVEHYKAKERQEAIEWVKAIDAYEARHHEACDLTAADFCCGDGAREWIIYFFSITEEELE